RAGDLLRHDQRAGRLHRSPGRSDVLRREAASSGAGQRDAGERDASRRGGSMSGSDTILLLPEIIIALGASLLLIVPVIGKRSSSGEAAKWVTLLLLAVTAASVVACSWIVADD